MYMLIIVSIKNVVESTTQSFVVLICFCCRSHDYLISKTHTLSKHNNDMQKQEER